MTLGGRVDCGDALVLAVSLGSVSQQKSPPFPRPRGAQVAVTPTRPHSLICMYDQLTDDLTTCLLAIVLLS